MEMTNLGDWISKSRSEMGLTQDQFGKKYDVSGPAVFKFEKNQVRPSLSLWLRMAKDTELGEEQAVLLWARARLPEEYRAFVDLEPPAPSARKKAKPKKKGKPAAPDALRKAILADRSAPKGLKELLRDGTFWTLYKPTSAELELLSTEFAQLGHGTKAAYREALRLAREFKKK